MSPAAARVHVPMPSCDREQQLQIRWLCSAPRL